ncbi:MAG: NUDIX domain-containing protein [Endomicrobium sp.]|jgi:8-oxo-dGTP pyrophosphatase MutT (NUDIX family)|nr:NUDIX domain-containing protein [Endomicrobium sp.]
MVKETSCGAIVYKIENNNPLFVLVKTIQCNRWGFPKGHIEKGETEKETAIREIFEETGIKQLQFDNSFRHEDIYIIDDEKTAKLEYKIEKHVIYFLALANNDEILVYDKNEISEIRWIDFQKAKELLFFHNSKEILSLAYNKILRRNEYE